MTRVSMTQAHPQTCRCGTMLTAPSKFCPSCGTPVAAGTSVTLVAPAPTPTLTRPASMVGARTQVTPPRSSSIARIRTALARTENPSAQEDLIFAVDCSPSMEEVFDGGQTKLQAAQNAACQMVCVRRKTAPNDRIGIVRFWENADVVAPLTPVGTGGRDLLRAIQNIEYADGTDLAAGLAEAGDLFDWDAHGTLRRIVLLTDGMGGDPGPIADRLKVKGVVIEVIGVAAGRGSDQLDEPLLRRVASTVAGQLKYAFIRDHATLLATFTNIATRVAPPANRANLAAF